MFRLIPPPLHRLILRAAFVVRHRWRLWRKIDIAGVSVVLRDLDGRLLMVRHSYGSQMWSLPGGGLKRDEEPAEAARREVREELGCEITGLTLIASFEEEISGSQHTAHIFSGVLDGMPGPDMREIIEARFYPRHSLPHPMSPLARKRIELWFEWHRTN